MSPFVAFYSMVVAFLATGALALYLIVHEQMVIGWIVFAIALINYMIVDALFRRL